VLPPEAAMQDTGFESPFDFYDEFELDYSTPVATPFDSPNIHGGPQQLIPESNNEEPDFYPLRYTILWKLQLRKGRIIKLTEDTIEDVIVAPSAYWNEFLESELETVVKDNVPEPQYQSDETTIAVSTSKREEPAFLKRFNKLTVTASKVQHDSCCISAIDEDSTLRRKRKKGQRLRSAGWR
jgi:hypothetical protein